MRLPKISLIEVSAFTDTSLVEVSVMKEDVDDVTTHSEVRAVRPLKAPTWMLVIWLLEMLRFSRPGALANVFAPIYVSRLSSRALASWC